VVAFADEYGLPVAIKAAFGGGGRGLKVARTREEIPEQFASATREALAAFGRGECFVEKYLDKPRHVETQCLADEYGTVVVVSTRDCSLQRRHQKLVEEAPAPFLTPEQTERLYTASKAILKEVGYVGAGTCEFLVGADGTVSFLEVNTRLQVEHPVSEEVTGLDLVREQFAIAEGARLDPTDPVPHGHSIEFRINGEDPGRNFLPSPGPVASFRVPGGPGVRVDSGVTTGDVVSGAFDSLLAKLIVTGANRQDALERSRRALAEFEVSGLPTVIPFHRAVVRDPAFTAAGGAFTVHTRWIETEFAGELEPWTGSLGDQDAVQRDEDRRRVTVEVNGKRIEVSLPAALAAGAQAPKPAAPPRRRRGAGGRSGLQASGNSVKAPMQATVVKIPVESGQRVVKGDLVAVLEAMKMEQPLTAHRDGVIGQVGATVGSTVSAGTVLLEILDEVPSLAAAAG
jgi:acetyl-CoA/propionyl-CoA carboxylase biotin carboxyl carrier protein